MKKVDNVIRGYRARYDINELTIINGYEIEYSGDINGYLKVDKKAGYLFKEKLRLGNLFVAESKLFNRDKLFLFVTDK